MKRPKIRLDFALISKYVVENENVNNYYKYITNSFRFKTDKNNLTSILSDHFPIKLNWKYM